MFLKSGSTGVLSRDRMSNVGKKPHKCDICHKRFTQSGSFERHKMTHMGENPYECDICQKKSYGMQILLDIRQFTQDWNLMNVIFVKKRFLWHQGLRSNFWIEGPNAELSTRREMSWGSEFTGLRQTGTRQKNIQYPARNDNIIVKTSYSSCFDILINSLL